MILHHSILFLTIFISTIHSHGSYHSRDRQGHERTWFQMSIPYLDTTIQFQPPPGLEPDRLFDLMTPFQNWNPMDPTTFMRPFFDRPNQFRPMVPPPPPSHLPTFPPHPTPETPTSPSHPNSVSEPEPESSFSISTSFNPSRRRWKPRWQPHPHHRGNGFSGKRPHSSRPSGERRNGCRDVPGTKGGRKCRPGHRFWEKSKPAEPQPTWPFFVFPPPRPSISHDKPEVPNTFTEVTKNSDPACGNRHLPRPTRPAESSSTTTTTMAPSDKDEASNESNNKIPKETSSSTSTTTEAPITSDSFDVAPDELKPSSNGQPSSPDPDETSVSSTPSVPSSSPSDLTGSNVEPEEAVKPSTESESQNGSNGSENEPGKEAEKKSDEEDEKRIESSSSSSLPKDDEFRERTYINNGEDISSSGMVTTMGPLQGSDGKENGNKKMEETKDDSDEDDKKTKIESEENEKENDNRKKETDETVDLKYSPFSSSPTESSSPASSSSSPSSSPSEVTTILNDNVNNEVVSTMSSADLGNIDLLNEADILPDEIDKSSNNKKSASPEVEAKRKREAEKEQFIKQIESMSIEDFRKLASKLASLSS